MAYCISNCKFYTCLLLVLALLIGTNAQAQFLDKLIRKSDQKESPLPVEDINGLKADIGVLSNPRQPARISGTTGELSAANFLSQRMGNIGLLAVDKKYQRKFSFESAMTASLESKLIVGNTQLNVPMDAIPLAFSANKDYTNFIISGSNDAGNIWLLPAKYEAAEPEGFSEAKLYQDARNAELRGAQAIIFYLSNDRQHLKFNTTTILPQLPIPVFLISADAYRKNFNNIVNLTAININAIIKPELRSGINVYGLLNNGAKKTVIISSSYDVAESAQGMSPGADDNASGVAAMLLMAKRIKALGLNGYNYMFIAYSASHLNLQGSEALFADKNFKTNAIAYAIHFDKIGKMSSKSPPIANGVGTYAGFKQYFATAEGKADPIQTMQKGTDTSDYNNYYQAQIPYISYTTGADAVHGTDRDIQGTIHFGGVGVIVQHALSLVAAMDQKAGESIAFVPASDAVMATTTNIRPPDGAAAQHGSLLQKELEVSLGIIPDLAYKEGGILIGKLTAKKDAAIAGLRAGDIIVQIRNLPIQNYSDYIAALSQFKKGQKTFIRFKRNGNIMQKAIVFT